MAGRTERLQVVEVARGQRHVAARMRSAAVGWRVGGGKGGKVRGEKRGEGGVNRKSKGVEKSRRGKVQPRTFLNRPPAAALMARQQRQQSVQRT
jgi:hypothetical protein